MCILLCLFLIDLIDLSIDELLSPILTTPYPNEQELIYQTQKSKYMSILEGKTVFFQHILYVLLIKQVGLKKNQILLLIQQIEYNSSNVLIVFYTLFCPFFHRGTFSP